MSAKFASWTQVTVPSLISSSRAMNETMISMRTRARRMTSEKRTCPSSAAVRASSDIISSMS